MVSSDPLVLDACVDWFHLAGRLVAELPRACVLVLR
jgi:hypothetical protein